VELQPHFEHIIKLIENSKNRVFQKVNSEIIELYWNIGKYLHEQIESESWGKSIVKELAEFVKNKQPNVKGFSSQNLWRMRQFYESYKADENLSTLSREIPWSHNMAIISATKNSQEREFYLKLVIKERLTFRELERQIDSSFYERVMLGNTKLSTLSREFPKDVSHIFKDTYVLEMLQLPLAHSEKELKLKITQNISKFLLEFGRDFAFMGEEYPIQVGNQDFAIDLLFYHRTLQCMVAIELKIEKFKPEFLGQLNFYLEALDRNVKTENEMPSIGILLCKGKDDTVVEYALNRSLSPTLVADYKTQLPQKEVLKQKWQELLIQLENAEKE
jgi:predicted nuclease of restriction endonuclease-like (RecB) superfamily